MEQSNTTINTEEYPPTWLQLRWWNLREAWFKAPERISRWTAWHLPRSVAMWAFIRVAGHASTAQWGNERPDTISVITCLERWDVPHDPQPPISATPVLAAADDDDLQVRAW